MSGKYAADAAEPRAVVAIGQDRQWLVVLEPEPSDQVWLVLRWTTEWDGDWYNTQKTSRDTGQEAHEVLAPRLERQAG